MDGYFIFRGIFMKKALISALTTALVVGAVSTTFAAANPFSDVPSDSWAYDAVSQLAKDGVVEDYGDGTYRGQATITRYEMAQVVAKAMAKTDVSKADKAILDKLAAEFADELNNLGVRVSSLEKKVDNVKWGGELRYEYVSERHDSGKENSSQVLFRMEPQAAINQNWVAKARIDYTTDAGRSENAGNAIVDRMYAEGTYSDGAFVARLGKLPAFSIQGVVIDDPLSGAEIAFGTAFKTTITAGRYKGPDSDNYSAGSYQAIQFDYAASKKLALAAAYQNFGQRTFVKALTNSDDSNLGIWSLGTTYKFTDTLAGSAFYGKSNASNLASKNKTAYNFEVDYKGADQANKGSFGIYAAYRHLGKAAVLVPTFDGAESDQKGWEIGGNYTFAPNIVGTALYFKGKDITADTDASKIFGKVEFFF
jgi:hypothetical protein